MVDLDLALTGEPRNVDVLRAIVALGAGVQAAGAIVQEDQIAAALEAGAQRVVLGSGALDELDETGRLIERYGDRLVIGIEVDRDRIRARGRRTTDLPLRRTLSAVHAAGAARVVITSVRRVSTMTGPDVGALAIAVRIGLPSIAAGGIASVGDLEAVRDAGAEGAIVGRAALEGRLDLTRAIASVA